MAASQRLSFRVSVEEHQALALAAARAGVSPSAYLRALLGRDLAEGGSAVLPCSAVERRELALRGLARAAQRGSAEACRTLLRHLPVEDDGDAGEVVGGLSPANPLALVRAPRAEHREQVRALAPATVERIRAALDPEGAAIVAVLAYAGLRPGELRALRWGDVRERTMLVQRGADSDGNAKTTKTRSVRTVRLLVPLAADLKEWRMASGRPGDDALVFPREDGSAWTKDDWDVFRANGWKTACKHAQLVPAPRPTTSATRSPRCCSLRAARSTTWPRSSAIHLP